MLSYKPIGKATDRGRGVSESSKSRLTLPNLSAILPAHTPISESGSKGVTLSPVRWGDFP
jgi:hypothetical protein